MFLVVRSAVARLLSTFINSSAEKCFILHCTTLCSNCRHGTPLFNPVVTSWTCHERVNRALLYGTKKYISPSLAANKHFLRKTGLILYMISWQQNISFCLSFYVVSTPYNPDFGVCAAQHPISCRALYLMWLVSLYFLQECEETDKIVSKIFQR